MADPLEQGTDLVAGRRCAQCGALLAPEDLVCDECHALVYGAQLAELAQKATDAESKQNFVEARDVWQQSLALLPADAKQAHWIRQKLQSLPLPVEPESTGNGTVKKAAGPVAAFLAVLAKMKGALLAIFKLKFLFSFFSFFGLYWAWYGWRFGLGLAVSILLHEMGHYVCVRAKGLPAEMPVFLPGFGAYVRWQAMGVSEHVRSVVSLAGPFAGFVTAVVCLTLYIYTGQPLWSALAHVGAMLNLLNLIPVWVLDGGQAMPAMAKYERIWLLFVALALWMLTGEGIFFLLAAGMVWALFQKNRAEQPDWNIFAYYSFLLVGLGIVLHYSSETAKRLPH